MRTQILIAFSDGSLGGTSRSAHAFALAWKALGHDVVFFSDESPHPIRLRAMSSIGRVTHHPDDIDVSKLLLIHFHHGAWSARMTRLWRLILSIGARSRDSVPLLTNNVFAVPDRLLIKWPHSRATAVLGTWAAAQYMSASGGASHPWIIPNPQDSSIFCPTSTARSLDSTRSILRVGSPLDGKWSKSYVDLAHRIADQNIHLKLMGAPESLRRSLIGLPWVSILPPEGQDDSLVKLYHCSSVMAVDSSRGESFGNVIAESILCGTPVVYRAREYRDNTPWEFQSSPLFFYETSKESWISRVLLLADRSLGHLDDRLIGQASRRFAEGYGLDAVTHMLEEVSIRLLQRDGLVTPPYCRAKELGSLNLFKILLGHNPIVAAIKAHRVLGMD